MDSFVTPASWDQVVVGDDCLGLGLGDRWEYGTVAHLSPHRSDRWAQISRDQDGSPFVVAELHQIRVPRHRVEREVQPDRIDKAARILELEAALVDLLKVATGETRHDFQGLCPDATDQRDPDCPACKVLLAAEAQLQPACPDCGERSGWDEKFTARVCRGCRSCVPREDGQLRFSATLRGETTDAPE